MVGTIVPVVNGNGAKWSERWLLVFHTCGLLVGGVVAGITVGLIGVSVSLLEHNISVLTPRHLISATALLIFGARELGLMHFTAPTSGWQVPRSWIPSLGIHSAALSYGAVLGTGVLTRISNTGFHALIVWAMFSGRLLWCMVLLTWIAVWRAVPVLIVGRLYRNLGCDIGDCLRFATPFQRIASVCVGLVCMCLGAFYVIQLLQAWSVSL